MTATSVPKGTKRRCEIQGQERQQGETAKLTLDEYESTEENRDSACFIITDCPDTYMNEKIRRSLQK